VDIVNSFVANTIAVLTEFAPPDRLGAALDKLYALQEAAVPGTREAQGRASHRYG
jgi:hypothetical protein